MLENKLCIETIELVQYLEEVYKKSFDYVSSRVDQPFINNYKKIESLKTHEGMCYVLYDFLNSKYFNNNNSDLIQTVVEALVNNIGKQSLVFDYFSFADMPVGIKSLNKFKNKTDKEKNELMLNSFNKRLEMIKTYENFLLKNEKN